MFTDSNNSQKTTGIPTKRKVIYIAAIICVVTLGYFSQKEFLRASNRSPVSRVKADFRSLATAIESYNIDYGGYPASSADPNLNLNRALRDQANATLGQPTFIVPVGSYDQLHTLTTPVSYLSGYVTDPLSPNRGQFISYWVPPRQPDWDTDMGWIAWSAGPDGDYDLNIDNIAEAYEPEKRVPNDYLINHTYDPTNGSTSNGDVYRIKQ